MTTTVIITFCCLLLTAYLFDLTSSKTKIPSAILLLILGGCVRQLTIFLNIRIPDLSASLPFFGTIGLILIVLEGSLELELNQSKFKLIGKSFVVALVPLLGSAFLLAYLFDHFVGFGLKNSLANAIPFCVISSAIAIPTVRSFGSSDREFVIYESSLSDILGVLFFNFITLNHNFDFHSFEHFGLQLVLIIVVSFVATVGLSFLLSKIDHHIKFVPIILLVILIYAVSKVYHLPGLIFILLFGLFIGNLDELKRFKWIQKFKPEELNNEVMKFKELTVEATFIVRAIFFLLFGYLIETSEILNTESLVWALGIVAIIFSFRAITLKIFNIPLQPLLYVAPRGLITILLFLSLEPNEAILTVNKSLIIQVIILAALVMMFGVMFSSSRKKMPEQSRSLLPMTLHKAHISDLLEIQALFKETILTVCHYDYNEEQLTVWASGVESKDRWENRILEQHFLLIKIEEQIVGYASLDKNHYVDLLYVHKDFQRKGIAKALILALEEEARKVGTQLLSADVSKTARPFFEKMGFEVIKEQTNLIKGVEIVNYKMTKELFV